eukprot:Phypoly_transcript_11279.p1 GENE.Phypoly_transcript_11279~~Phypoly_transcript_11279.p1  ORF type:complete len:371 (+),score=74.77 Phypoly_transcript_11279:38-1150(+)
MRVENIVRTLPCSPHEFIEIYQEGKVLEQVAVEHITKLQEWEDGKERVIKFVSDAYAPENLLKIMGCNSQQLKEQQELRITEDGIKIHTFYLPDMVPDAFRVETFWNITKESLSVDEGDTGSSIVDISVHSESGSYSVNQLLETFVAKSVAAAIIQYLDIVDSYFAKFRTKMKQLLDPRNFIPANFLFGSGKLESEQSTDVEIIESEEEQAERIQEIIKELKQTKNQLFRESQRILQMEIEFSEKNPSTPSAIPRPDTPPPVRTLNQATRELWKTRQPSTPPDHAHPHPVFHPEDALLLQTCETNLGNLQAQRAATDLEIDRALTDLECRIAKQTFPKRDSTLAHVYQCAKYFLPISLLVIAVLHRRKVL